ncbi:MAG: efflux RND transporter permease subunit [Acidobacteria bacterium]|nr:efflux RND transporter permease subunit [Acidobacteriota bacterium]
MNKRDYSSGSISWMARNPVAANLLMIVLLAGGAIIATQVKQEVFPEFDLDIIQISVPYPGASPAEVEQGIILAIEEAVRGLDGVKRVTGTAYEGNGIVRVELLLGVNSNKALQDIKNAVDRIITFPQDAERPIVSLLTNRQQVVTLVVYGNQSEKLIRRVAEEIRQDLLRDPRITLVELAGVRPLEISIEVPQAQLRAYNLTLEDVARTVSRTAVELPGGGVKTDSGEVMLRMAERRDLGHQFETIPVVSLDNGTQVKVNDIGTVIDGFRDTDQATFYNGRQAAEVVVYRVGDQTPLDVAAAVKEDVADLESGGMLPPGINVAIWDDRSEIYWDRIHLLMRNAALGLALVLLILGLFLELRLAFWVTLGIPISFLGSMLALPAMDVSINMISLFAFIVTLGIVVDDAIVVGENIYEQRQRGLSYMDAAIKGARQIAGPVTFAILTNVVAFTPLFFVPGASGKFFSVIPAIVIAVFIVSLVEALYILPAHLGHQKPPKREGFSAWLYQRQQAFSRGLDWYIRNIYTPSLRIALRWRYLTISAGLAVLIAIVGLVVGGRVEFSFLPKVESDMIIASAELPFGSPVSETIEVKKKLLKIAQDVLEPHGGESITRGILTQVGTPPRGGGPSGGSELALSGGHLANVMIRLVPSEQRTVTAEQLTNEWRDSVGDIPGLETLTFQYNIGPAAGAPIDVELSHPDPEILEISAAELAEALREFQGVRDIDDGFANGKPQIDFKIKPEARSLGLVAAEVGRQVRSAFYGYEAIRQQRGRDEIRIMVRLPEAERKSLHNIEELVIRTPQGGEIPLNEAAEIIRGRSYTEIRRADARRVLNVTADVVPGQANAGNVLVALQAEDGPLPTLLQKYPGLSYSLEGEQREQRETFVSLGIGFLLAQFVIYALLAIPFKSYIQPVLVMSAIPFGIVGAVLGHVAMGYELSIMSMMGIVALTGVVVNDSLILIDTTNRYTRRGKKPFEAITEAGARRFRPILLTTLTTFFGLSPMILETSVQARFLVPMAISLGFGILFATFIVLLLVPCQFLIVEDLLNLVGRTQRKSEKSFPALLPQEPEAAFSGSASEA